ncbi:PVC-type heme-binding CxxCH protein [Planctomicrobium sp. SH668]|uniref:PVC-type heme-binding CxxCH protein n=1 Tax=Planctomicrobium sp. SH668 TaxID=3448126 RepID=UPI003F5C8ACC
MRIFFPVRCSALLVSVFVWGLLAGSTSPVSAQTQQDVPLNVLFLGDNGHHRPADRFADLAPALEKRNFRLKYTDDVAVALTAETLDQFDALILYANIDTIQPAQEQALIDFVSKGKAFIPLHCASFCFRNSPRFIALVGGQFQRHGGEVFSVENAAPDHPIMKGYSGFESWDETYIHTLHNEKDRTILEYRVQGEQADGQTQEPWTWVRTEGKGRVFYTAWGHDERTFQNPVFHNLVERGIRWACGQDLSSVPDSEQLARSPFKPLPMTKISTDAPKFDFIDVGPKIPNYAARVQGETKSLMQLPLSPSDSMKHYSVPEGFHLELFADESDFSGKPIAMNWDERGRLWICETTDYPNELQPVGEGRDRIRICEDTDGDGRADKFTVFAEKLSIPTSIIFAYGGAIVQDGRETVFLKDTNGDDTADLREILVRGWGMGDTHGGVSNFQYGLDNRIWAMQGYNHSTPTYGVGNQKASFRQGFFTIKVNRAGESAVVDDVEFIRSSNNNTWGFGMSEEGLIFGSTANHNPSMFMPVPNRYYERVRGWSAEQLGTIAETHLFNAITENVRQVDHFGGYTAAAGHALYTARNYPEQFWNRTAFVCEPTGHLVGTFVLNRNGAGYQSFNSMNLVAADDEWAAPVMAEVGPDGNVWILDWYNFIVQHNPTPAGFETGKGNAYESDLRDKKHGRIYRLIASNHVKQPSGLSIARPEELVDALKRDNLFWRRHAQRLLVERGDIDVVPRLLQLIQDQSTDAIGLNVGAIHALWTLSGLGVVNSDHAEIMKTVVAALAHPSAGVRRNALLVLPPSEASITAILESQLLGDTDSQVQLAAILALADMPMSVEAGTQLARVLVESPNILKDRWLVDAATSAASVHTVSLLVELKRLASENDAAINPALGGIVERVAEHLSRGRADSRAVEELLTIVDGASESLMSAIVSGFARGWPKDHTIELSADADAKLVAIFQALPAGTKGQLVKLTGSWGSRSLDQFVDEIIQAMLETANDSSVAESERLAVTRDLVSFQPQSDDVVARIIEFGSPRNSAELAAQMISSLSGSSAPQLGTQLIDRLSTFGPSARSAAIRVLLSRPSTTKELLAAIDAGVVQLSDLSLDQKQALSSHPEKSIREQTLKLLKQMGGLPDPDREKVIAELLPEVEKKGSVDAGKAIFLKQCAKCHTHSGEGQRIGPDLTGMSVHPRHELLIHLLDPNRSVEGNFRVYTVALESGQILSGMLAGESKTAIELIDTEGKRHAIAREDIDEIVGSKKSLMPEGFEKQMTVVELRDLMEFLTNRGKYIPLDLAKVATVSSTKGMFYSEEATGERLVFNDWLPKTVDGVPFQLVDPVGDSRPNVIMLRSPNGTIPPRMPTSVSLPVRSPAKAIHILGGVGGWSYPFSSEKSVSMIVRLHYADGSTEDHELKNAVHFADYIRVIDVPESKLAFELRGKQVRYLAITPRKPDVIESIDLVKGPDASAPVTMAITVESP